MGYDIIVNLNTGSYLIDILESSFGGEILPFDALFDESRWKGIDFPGFLSRNTKAIRYPEVFDCAGALRSEHKYSSIGALGFCHPGSAVFPLGAKYAGLVDCVSIAHPTFLEQNEIKEIGVPVQIMAPEHDSQFTEELKAFSNEVKVGCAV